ncbi:glycosyltransferase family 2 protein [Candidatus Leptofilum sp.]|uniref:glycosyltransferase family 2 protein n=1 Tax=Candidatus Leptofilum sp. TaxID=3241576 RepID=UPI003B5B7D03
MKLIIQIPCYNEAESLPITVAELPSHVPGISCIETLVIDDGSTDGTAEIARSLGINHIIAHRQNLGLARAFETGLDAALRLGADIIANTDADNQYPGRYIPELVAPVLAGKADIVIANRQIEHIEHFSPMKKLLQKLGSWTVRTVSGTDVPDAVSGFRAYSRDTALRLNILTNFSYTLDTIIQAGKQGLIIKSIPVETNGPIRPSRLQSSMWHFIKAQASTIIRLYAFYEPLRTFSYIALPFILAGLVLWGRFFYAYFNNTVNQFIQSVTIGTGLLLVGLLIFLFGVQADITSKHRQMTQETLYRLKKLELKQQKQTEDVP